MHTYTFLMNLVLSVFSKRSPVFELAEVPPVLELAGADVVGVRAEVPPVLELARVLRDGAEVPRGACVGVVPRPAAGGTGVTCKEETCVAMECYPFNWYIIYYC